MVRENLYSSFLFASPKALQKKHQLMPLSSPFLWIASFGLQNPSVGCEEHSTIPPMLIGNDWMNRGNVQCTAVKLTSTGWTFAWPIFVLIGSDLIMHRKSTNCVGSWPFIHPMGLLSYMICSDYIYLWFLLHIIKLFLMSSTYDASWWSQSGR